MAKLPVYSYTFLNTFDICPKQAFHRFVLKDHPFVGSDASKWGDRVHKALEERIGKDVPLPVEMTKFEPYAAALAALEPFVEMKLGIRKDGTPCDFFADDVWLRGKADVVAKRDVLVLLADHKTGKKREDIYELEIQALMVHSRWPELERISGFYGWLQEIKPGRLHDVSNTGETLECVQEKADEIEHCHKTGEWRTKAGPLCGWCPVTSCNFNRLKDR